MSLIKEPGTVSSKTFRLDQINFDKAIAKEVRVTLSSKGKAIASENIFDHGGLISVRKREKDDGFEAQVSKSLFPFMSSPIEKRKKALSELLNGSKLYEVSDEDIENCTIVASVDGRDRVIYLLGDSNFASRFNLDVGLRADGHPKSEEVKKCMYDILKNDIISRKEHV